MTTLTIKIIKDIRIGLLPEIDARNLLTKDNSLLELKISTLGIISWTTRGQLGLNPVEKGGALIKGYNWFSI